MKKFDQLTKIYLESVEALSGPITSKEIDLTRLNEIDQTRLKEIAKEINRIYNNLDQNAKTISGGLVRDELEIVVDALTEAGLID